VSDPLGSYAFLPWLQRGLTTQITRVDDGSPSADQHVPLPVTITFNGTASTTATAPLALFGPAEVGGLDPHTVIRIWPVSGSYDAEPNYFPLIEFDQADLPWRYTPAKATAGDRLRPWMTLITLREDEIVAMDQAGPGGRLAAVTVADASALPVAAQLWAWAHVQLSGAQSPVDPAVLASVLSTAPERVISRLLSPRRLDPNARYVACVVPAFEQGRLAGLGLQVTGDALAPAWTAEQTNVTLPVYYQWAFGTGAGADFEFLARQLQARPVPATVGTRPVDVSTPGAGLPPAADAPLALEGALVPPGYVRSDGSNPLHDDFRTALANLLNTPDDLLSRTGTERVVAPPLYGRYYAKRERIDLTAGAEPVWFEALNGDPRDRVAAGLGTQVIQAGQRQLMASAWQQVTGIRAANERLRLTQLARAAALRLFARHIAPASATEVLALSAPVQAKVLASPTTIRARVAASTITPGVLAATFRRVSRPLGPLGRRIGFAAAPARVTALIGRLNDGGVIVAPPPPRPAGILSPGAAGPPVIPWWAAPARLAQLRFLQRWLPVVAVIAAAGAVAGLLAGSLTWFTALLAAGVLAFAAGVAAGRAADRGDLVAAFAAGRLTASALRASRPAAGFAPRAGIHLDASAVPGAAPGTGPPPSAAAVARSARVFRDAASALLADTSTAPAAVPDRVAVELDQLGAKLTAAVDPAVTITAGLAGRLTLPAGIARQPGTDPAEAVMAAPSFPQPMYRPLADLSADWLLPGLDSVPPNTTTVLETNQRFVEGYMTGLNQEMARELQWNEYPTDLQGSYFRQFWDVAGYVVPAGPAYDPDSLRDIKPLTSWDPVGTLGANRPAPPASGTFLVLLVRGEILRRYPNTIVYAADAVRGDSGHVLGNQERHPLFNGRLEPDVTFFGFDLTAAQVIGDPDPRSPNQGWFFVLQEQPSEPRFGLDIAGPAFGGQPARWSDLSWASLAPSAAGLAAIRYIDLDAALPDTSAVANPGGAAWHADAGTGPHGSRASDLAYITLQQPVRIAIHGADMIAPGPGTSG
jgi:hypothetical protein